MKMYAYRANEIGARKKNQIVDRKMEHSVDSTNY